MTDAMREMDAGREFDVRVMNAVFPYHDPECHYRLDEHGRMWLARRDAVDLGESQHNPDGSYKQTWFSCYDARERDFANDPAADYSVLVRVRETWEPMMVCEMRDALVLAWERRADTARRAGERKIVHGCTQYQPGDYSRAALAALPPAGGQEPAK